MGSFPPGGYGQWKRRCIPGELEDATFSLHPLPHCPRSEKDGYETSSRSPLGGGGGGEPTGEPTLKPRGLEWYAGRRIIPKALPKFKIDSTRQCSLEKGCPPLLGSCEPRQSLGCAWPKLLACRAGSGAPGGTQAAWGRGAGLCVGRCHGFAPSSECHSLSHWGPRSRRWEA